MAVKFWAGCQIIFISTIDQGENSALEKIFDIASWFLCNCCTGITQNNNFSLTETTYWIKYIQGKLFVISVF